MKRLIFVCCFLSAFQATAQVSADVINNAIGLNRTTEGGTFFDPSCKDCNQGRLDFFNLENGGYANTGVRFQDPGASSPLKDSKTKKGAR